jgi:signal transduction histidine kinase/ligand-binding sensor domain-containing protein
VNAESPIYQNYSVSDGLPSKTVYCAMQDNDGFLWFGTDAGVSRFDGKEFKNFTIKDGLTDNDILKIYKDSKGRLWFLTLKGILCYYYQGKIFNPSNDSNLPTLKANNGFLSFLEDDEHNLWFGGLASQLFKLPSNGKVQAFDLNALDLRKGTNGWVFLYQAEKGKIVLSGISGNHTYETKDFREVQNKLPEPRGEILGYENTGQYKGVLVSSTGIYELLSTQLKCLLSFDSLFVSADFKLFDIDRNGGIWLISKKNTVYYFEKDNDSFKKPVNYFPGKNVSRVYVDNEGNRWFCTLGNGILKVGENQKWISVLLGRDQTQNRSAENITSVFKDSEGTIWFGTIDGRVFLLRKIELKEAVDGFIDSGNRILSFAQDHSGVIYFLTDANIYKVRKKNEACSFERLKLFGTAALKRIVVDRDDHLIVSTSNGIREIIVNDLGTQSDLLLKEVPDQRVYSLCIDHKNEIWFENYERLFCHDRSTLKKYPQFDSLFVNRITDIEITRDSALLIVSQNNGVFVLKNEKVIDHFTVKDWPAGVQYRRIFVDGEMIYLSSNSGFASVRFKNMTFSDLRTYNTSNGILSNDINDLVVDANNIYLTTSDGICKIDKNFQINRAEPPVVMINSVRSNLNELGDLSNLKFTYNDFNITVNFIAITFDQPDHLSYQYKLKNGDSWVDLKSNFLQFSDLNPGSYQLSIRAKKINSDWGKAQSIAFTIDPPFWRTTWFYLLFVLVLIGAVYGIVKRITERRYKIELIELRAKQELEAERNRIASDMHDDFGADISKISVISELIKSDPGNSTTTVKQIQKISSYSSELRKKMDEIIWALDPSNDKLINLIVHIKELVAELREESGIDCRMEISEMNTDLVLTATIRRNIFLIVKEALNNCLKHSKATSVSLQIKMHEHLLDLVIQDNGIGFDVADRSIYNNGLANIEKRVRQINGELSIKSNVNEGTIISVNIKL